MNAFVAVLFFAAAANAGLIGHDIHGWNHAAHIPSGSVSVGHDGAVIAGPSGSIHTDNGLHGSAGARLSGPAGEVGTHGGLARLSGPGLEHGEWNHAAPIAHSVGIVAAPFAHGVATHTAVVGPSSHATIVGPTAHATIVAPSAHSWGHASLVAPSWGHSAYAVPTWGHGLVGLGHHGW